MFNIDFTRVAIGTFGTVVCAAICLLGATGPAYAAAPVHAATVIAASAR